MTPKIPSLKYTNQAKLNFYEHQFDWNLVGPQFGKLDDKLFRVWGPGLVTFKKDLMKGGSRGWPEFMT